MSVKYKLQKTDLGLTFIEIKTTSRRYWDYESREHYYNNTVTEKEIFGFEKIIVNHKILSVIIDRKEYIIKNLTDLKNILKKAKLLYNINHEQQLEFLNTLKKEVPEFDFDNNFGNLKTTSTKNQTQLNF